MVGVGVLLVLVLLWTASEKAKAAALSQRLEWGASDELVVLPPPAVTRFLAAGYRELVADITWARMLVYYGSTKIGNSDLRYLKPFIDTVITLDPHFRRVYSWASYSVTYNGEQATNQEFLDSIHYAELGMDAFPDDYEFFWIAGLRYSMDVRSDDVATTREYRERGAELVESAMRKPNAPPILATLAAELRTRLGQRERAVRNLREMIMTTDNDAARESMIAKLGGIAQSLDVADEIEAAREAFAKAWNTSLPFAPANLFVIVGERPSLVIAFDRLATDRDLFGTQELLVDGPENSTEIDVPLQVPADSLAPLEN